MPRRQRRRYYNPWGQGGYEFDKWLYNLAPAEGQNAYQAQEAYNAYARSEAGMQGGAQNYGEAGLQNAFQNMLSPAWEAERDNAQAAIEQGWQQQSQGLNGPTGRPQGGGGTLDTLPKSKKGVNKFGRLVKIEESISGYYQGIEEKVYTEHKYEEWMWVSIKNPSLGQYAWTNMYELYLYKKGESERAAVSTIPLPMIGNINLDTSGAIPPPYNVGNAVRYDLPTGNITVTITVVNNTGATFSVDIFQSAIPGFNYRTNRIARGINVPRGNTNFKFNVSASGGNNLTFAINRVPGGVININYANATYKEIGHEDSAPDFYVIHYFEQSVEESNFGSPIVLDFINDFYG